MSFIVGLDIGSALSKAVVMQDGKLLSSGISPSEGNFLSAINSVLQEALGKTKLAISDIDLIGACGLGASFIPHSFRKTSDISCQSRGTSYLLPTVRTLIEIGNQSSRIIKVTQQGKVADSLVSDKCAAGSGRILQIVAKVLNVDLKDMGQLSLKSTQPVKFTTGCAVFLETEAISRVVEGASKENIIAGLHQALTARVAAMAHRMGLEEDCVITGGGAKDSGLVKIMEEKLGKTLLVSDNPLITGAIGAAIIVNEKKG
ncbi:MAG: acyl-CoA dehydratase activase [Desulfobacterales bacterium]